MKDDTMSQLNIAVIIGSTRDQRFAAIPAEWVRKPVAFVGYGGLGAARAVEHLRGIVCELQMAPVRAAVHIGGSEFRAVHPHMGKQPFTEISSVVEPSGDEMLNDLIWWANALKAARLRELPASKNA
jgi:NAD(P)H-dependent FMN reductase